MEHCAPLAAVLFQSPSEDSSILTHLAHARGATVEPIVSIPFRGFVYSDERQEDRVQESQVQEVSIPFRGFVYSDAEGGNWNENCDRMKSFQSPSEDSSILTVMIRMLCKKSPAGTLCFNPLPRIRLF